MFIVILALILCYCSGTLLKLLGGGKVWRQENIIYLIIRSQFSGESELVIFLPPVGLELDISILPGHLGFGKNPS